MAIDELAQSLLARQDRQREEDWERQRKARKRARREQLLGAAGGIAVNIGNRVLAQRAQEFMDKEFDMSSRAKYKQAISAGLDTQKLHAKIREQGYTNSSDWKYKQLEEAVQNEHRTRLGETWDGIIPVDTRTSMKAKADVWGTDFDTKYEESFKLQNFADYQASVQRRFGRPTSIQDWVVRGITDRAGGKTRKEGRGERAAALRAEIDNFDEDYRHLYDDTVQRTGDASFASDMVDLHAGSHRSKVTGFKELNGWVVKTFINTDGDLDYTRVEKIRAGEKFIQFGHNSSGIALLSINDEGEEVMNVLQKPTGIALTSAQKKDLVRTRVSDIFSSDDYAGLGNKEKYNKLRTEKLALWTEGITAQSPLLMTFFNERTGGTNASAQVFGGYSKLENQIDAQFETLFKEGAIDDSYIMKSFKDAGFSDEEIELRIGALNDFGDRGYKADQFGFRTQVAYDVMEMLDKDKNLDTTDLITDAIVQRSKALVAHGGSGGWFGKDRWIYAPMYTKENERLKAVNAEMVAHNSMAELRKGRNVPLKAGAAATMTKMWKDAIASGATEQEIWEQLHRDVVQPAIGVGWAGAEMPQEVEIFYQEGIDKGYGGTKKRKEDEISDDLLREVVARVPDFKGWSLSKLRKLPPTTLQGAIQEAEAAIGREKTGRQVGVVLGKAGRAFVEKGRADISFNAKFNRLSQEQKDEVRKLQKRGVSREEAYEIVVSP